MRFSFKCDKCNSVFEQVASPTNRMKLCPFCGSKAYRQFHACTNIYTPSYFHTSRSDIFDEGEWQDLKKNPDIERAK